MAPKRKGQAKPAEPTVSTRISADAHYKLKMYAVQQRRQLLEVLDEAAAEYLKKRA